MALATSEAQDSFPQSREGQPFPYEKFLQSTIFGQEELMTAATSEVFSSAPNENSKEFRSTTSRLIAAELVASHIAQAIEHTPSGVIYSPKEVQAVVNNALENNALNAWELDEAATGAWERLLFTQGKGASAVVSRMERMQKGDVALGVMSEYSMNAVLTHAKKNLTTHLSANRAYAGTAKYLREVRLALEGISQNSGIFPTKENSFGFQGRLGHLKESVATIASHIEPMLFTDRRERQSQEFRVWKNSAGVNRIRERLGIFTADKLQTSLENSLIHKNKATSRDTLIKGAREVFRSVRAKSEWNALTVHGQAAATILLLFEPAPEKIKTKMILENPQLAKTYAHIARHGAPELRALVSSWRDAGALAVAINQSAEYTALVRSGFSGRAQKLIAKMRQSSLPAVSFAEERTRTTKKLAVLTGVGIASLLLQACGAPPADAPPVPTTTPLPDVDLVSSHTTLLDALDAFHIDTQCAFPRADVDANASYIASFNTQLASTDLALATISGASVDLSGYDLICDAENERVYFENGSGDILLATANGLLPGEMIAGIPQVITPTESSPTLEAPTLDGGVIPEFLPLSGGPVPEFLTYKGQDGTQQSEWEKEIASQKQVMIQEGIDPKNVEIIYVGWETSDMSPGGSFEFRWGSVLRIKGEQAILWARYDDGILEFTPRPDMRPESRVWHYEKVTIPTGIPDTIEMLTYFPLGADAHVVLLADTNDANENGQPRVVARFDTMLGTFVDISTGEVVKQPNLPVTDFPRTPQEIPNNSTDLSAMIVSGEIPKLTDQELDARVNELSAQWALPTRVVNATTPGDFLMTVDSKGKTYELDVPVPAVFDVFHNEQGTTVEMQFSNRFTFLVRDLVLDNDDRLIVLAEVLLPTGEHTILKIHMLDIYDYGIDIVLQTLDLLEVGGTINLNVFTDIENIPNKDKRYPEWVNETPEDIMSSLTKDKVIPGNVGDTTLFLATTTSSPLRPALDEIGLQDP